MASARAFFRRKEKPTRQQLCPVAAADLATGRTRTWRTEPPRDRGAQPGGFKPSVVRTLFTTRAQCSLQSAATTHTAPLQRHSRLGMHPVRTITTITAPHFNADRHHHHHQLWSPRGYACRWQCSQSAAKSSHSSAHYKRHNWQHIHRITRAPILPPEQLHQIVAAAASARGERAQARAMVKPSLGRGCWRKYTTTHELVTLILRACVAFYRPQNKREVPSQWM